MVDNWGTGFQDFTSETAISGVASVSGNVISISGAVNVSGAVSIFGNYIYQTKTLVITGASGGVALGSGLTTSGFVVQSVAIKIPEVKTSGATNYGNYINSGTLAPLVYVGGYSGSAPYAGGGYVCSSKGLAMAPGEVQTFYTNSLDNIYAASETSGNPLVYLVAMR
jgi:hypothetical protein